jgi:hypothetical protein
VGDSAQRKSTIVANLLIGVRVVDNGTTANVADLLIRNVENAAENLSQPIREISMFDEDPLTECSDDIFRNNMAVKSSFLKKGGPYAKYIVIPDIVLKDPHPSMSICERMLYGILMSYIRKEGKGKCNPGIKTIALQAGLSERQVGISLRNLKEALWVNWKRTGGSSLFRIYSPMERDMKIAMLSSKNERNSVKNSCNINNCHENNE